MSAVSAVQGRTRSELQELAESQGKVCIIPEKDELLLDLDDVFDDTWSFPLDDPTLKALESNGFEVRLPILSVESPGGNTHVYLKLLGRIEDEAVRIALQAALGSDPVREALSGLRVLSGCEIPSVLFETPDMAERVLSWRVLFTSDAF